MTEPAASQSPSPSHFDGGGWAHAGNAPPVLSFPSPALRDSSRRRPTWESTMDTQALLLTAAQIAVLLT